MWRGASGVSMCMPSELLALLEIHGMHEGRQLVGTREGVWMGLLSTGWVCAGVTRLDGVETRHVRAPASKWPQIYVPDLTLDCRRHSMVAARGWPAMRPGQRTAWEGYKGM